MQMSVRSLNGSWTIELYELSTALFGTPFLAPRILRFSYDYREVLPISLFRPQKYQRSTYYGRGADDLDLGTNFKRMLINA